MADYKLDKYDSDRAALKKKYPNARMTPYIDKMKGETFDSEQGKASKEYGNIVDEFNKPDAGAGRGKQGGPTAKELADYEDKLDAGIYTKEKGKPPMDPEVAKKRGGMVNKMASGGSVGMDKARDKAMILKAFKQHDAQEHKGGKGTVLKLSSGGSASKRADGIAQRGRTRA